MLRGLLSEVGVAVSKLEESMARQREDAGIVYEVLRPLYGIPSSARALHFSLAKWFKAEGFQQAGFEESVFIRKA